ncbi:MAG: class I SAM-dependent methyltransferase [bacterium]|nr:class I SAM-dependent methyltransferase [bacterium]
MPDHDMEKYYRARAPEYEQIYYRDVPERRRELTDEASRLEELVTGRSVLELACGTGYWTQIVSRSAASITASDLSVEMLAEAEKKAYGIPVDFVPADMFEHNFGQQKFDVVALGFWFSHQPRQKFDRLFEVLKTPLKKGGLIWMIDNNPPAEGPTIETAGLDEFGNNYKRRFLDSGEQYTILKNYFSKTELEAALSPFLAVKSLIHNKYYWSVVLKTLGN